MNSKDIAALIGQATADAVWQQALIASLLELHPDLLPRLEAKVLVADLATRGNLNPKCSEAYSSRMQDMKQFVHAAASI